MIFVNQLMADSEPSLVSVRELPESTELSNVELDQPTTDDTQQLLDNEDGQDGTEDNLEDSFIPDQWNIQSRLNQRRAKWSVKLFVLSVCGL